MSYRPIPAGGTGGGEVNENPYPYQPFVPNPVLSVGTPTTGTAGQSLYPITVTDALAGAVLFYSINNSSGGFAPYTAPFNLNSGQVGYSYGAKIGYTNSEVIFVQAPSAPGGEVVTGDDGLPASGDDAANVTVGGPAPPGGLIATVAPAQVTLSWYASTGATGYTVNRGTTSKNYNTTFTTTGTGYVDTAVTSGTKYFYAVTATETGMSSGYSNEVSATPS
jgi:cellulose 1,4-beta-cellobiosidase